MSRAPKDQDKLKAKLTSIEDGQRGFMRAVDRNRQVGGAYRKVTTVKRKCARKMKDWAAQQEMVKMEFNVFMSQLESKWQEVHATYLQNYESHYLNDYMDIQMHEKTLKRHMVAAETQRKVVKKKTNEFKSISNVGGNYVPQGMKDELQQAIHQKNVMVEKLDQAVAETDVARKLVIHKAVENLQQINEKFHTDCLLIEQARLEIATLYFQSEETLGGKKLDYEGLRYHCKELINKLEQNLNVSDASTLELTAPVIEEHQRYTPSPTIRRQRPGSHTSTTSEGSIYVRRDSERSRTAQPQVPPMRRGDSSRTLTEPPPLLPPELPPRPDTAAVPYQPLPVQRPPPPPNAALMFDDEDVYDMPTYLEPDDIAEVVGQIKSSQLSNPSGNIGDENRGAVDEAIEEDDIYDMPTYLDVSDIAEASVAQHGPSGTDAAYSSRPADCDDHMMYLEVSASSTSNSKDGEKLSNGTSKSPNKADELKQDTEDDAAKSSEEEDYMKYVNDVLDRRHNSEEKAIADLDVNELLMKFGIQGNDSDGERDNYEKPGEKEVRVYNALTK